MTFKMKAFTKQVVLFSLLVMTPLSQAHHSFAVHFHADQMITATGVVEEFRFSNPHGMLLFNGVDDETGESVSWRAETNSPNMLRRRGWNRDSLEPGDVVTVTGFLAREDSHYMRISYVEFEDGTEELRAQGQAD